MLTHNQISSACLFISINFRAKKVYLTWQWMLWIYPREHFRFTWSHIGHGCREVQHGRVVGGDSDLNRSRPFVNQNIQANLTKQITISYMWPPPQNTFYDFCLKEILDMVSLTSKSSSFFRGRLVMTTPLLNSSRGWRRSAVRLWLLSLTRLPQRSWNVRRSLALGVVVSRPKASTFLVRSFTIWLDSWVRNSFASWLATSLEIPSAIKHDSNKFIEK